MMKLYQVLKYLDTDPNIGSIPSEYRVVKHLGLEPNASNEVYLLAFIDMLKKQGYVTSEPYKWDITPKGKELLELIEYPEQKLK